MHRTGIQNMYAAWKTAMLRKLFFLVCYLALILGFGKTATFLVVLSFFPSNAVNKFFQSFPENITTPTVLQRVSTEEMNFRIFKHWFFLKTFLSVTSGRNQNFFLRSGVFFSLTRLIYFSLIVNSCFWFVTCHGGSVGFHKTTGYYYFMSALSF